MFWALLLTFICFCVPVFAAEAPTIPNIGVDIASYIPVALTAIGAVIAAVVGGYFAFLLVRKGLSWVGRFFGNADAEDEVWSLGSGDDFIGYYDTWRAHRRAGGDSDADIDKLSGSADYDGPNPEDYDWS